MEGEDNNFNYFCTRVQLWCYGGIVVLVLISWRKLRWKISEKAKATEASSPRVIVSYISPVQLRMSPAPSVPRAVTEILLSMKTSPINTTTVKVNLDRRHILMNIQHRIFSWLSVFSLNIEVKLRLDYTTFITVRRV